MRITHHIMLKKEYRITTPCILELSSYVLPFKPWVEHVARVFDYVFLLTLVQSMKGQEATL